MTRSKIRKAIAATALGIFLGGGVFPDREAFLRYVPKACLPL